MLMLKSSEWTEDFRGFARYLQAFQKLFEYILKCIVERKKESSFGFWVNSI